MTDRTLECLRNEIFLNPSWLGLQHTHSAPRLTERKMGKEHRDIVPCKFWPKLIVASQQPLHTCSSSSSDLSSLITSTKELSACVQ